MNRIGARHPGAAAGREATHRAAGSKLVHTVGMKRVRAVPAVVVAVAAFLVLAGCSDGSTLPEREPEAVGTADAVVTEGDQTRVSFVPDAGYEYFEGTTFVLTDEIPVTGAVEDAADIAEGDSIQVWSEACAESFPVQCQVEGVEVLD